MTVIITKNSATASAVPTASDLVQGELAVNVADKRLFTEDDSAQIIEIGTNPTSLTSATVTVSANLNATGTLSASNAVISGGTINGSVIGGSSPLAITGTVITANTGFVGDLTGNVTGNLTGNVTGNLTGNVTGDVTGNVTASSGTTSLHNLALTGTVDFNTARLTDIGAPVAATDAVTKAYADQLITNLIDGAPAALDTLNELAAALDDDAAFHTTVTNSIALKLPLAGGTMSGAIAMGTNKITGAGDPTAAQDLTTKAYVDTQVGGGLPTSGGTMSGAIAMGNNKITGLATPTDSADSTTKAYVDGILGSATSAATSATAAANSATASASSASAASTSESNAATSATASASSAAAAATTYDNFDDRYLGDKSSDPTVDNDGNALLTGAIYFNTTNDKMKVYTGAAWVDVAPVATSITVSQISDLTVDATELNYVDGVTSNVQTQLNTLTTAVGNVSVTNGSLTKTFAAGETADITLSSGVLVPNVSVIKEISQTGATNNNWDASAGSYTLENSAPSTSLSFVGFDVSAASFVDSFSVASQDGGVRDLFFNADGTKMFIIGTDNNTVYQYTLSTGFDVSTASYDNVSFSVASQDSQIFGLAFSADGTKMFIAGNSTDAIYEYTLTTGFDISTASYTRSFSVSSQDAAPTALAFNTDGTKMFVCGIINDNVFEYALTTGFNISTASYSQSFSITPQDTTPLGICFNTDGTKMFIVGATNDAILEYTLSTGFDVSTASFVDSFGVTDSVPTGVQFSADGFKMFVSGGTGDAIYEYDIAKTIKLGTGSFASGDVGKTIIVNDGEFLLTATSGTFSQVIAPSSYATASSGSWALNSVIYDATNDVLKTSAYIAGFNISNSTYSNFGLNGGTTSLKGVAISPDGTKMFIAGGSNMLVLEYTLSTPFDVTSFTYVRNYNTSSQIVANLEDIAFNTDGTSMYALSINYDKIFQYTLTTGFDLSTASYASKNLAVGGQQALPKGFCFSNDGTVLISVGYTDSDADKYNLTTAFDLSTASFAGDDQRLSFASVDAYPEAVSLSEDGLTLLMAGSSYDRIYEYHLTAPNVIVGATYVRYFSVQSQESSLAGLCFGNNGTQMYIVGTSQNRAFQYSSSVSNIPTGYQPCISSNIDTTYWTDLNSTTATDAVGNGSVFYAVSTDNKTTWKVQDATGAARSIVKNNSGTYQYNSNATFGSETWTNATTNTEVSALRESMAVAVNKMTSTTLNALSDANQIALGNDLDFAAILYIASGSTVPTYSGTALNYDANVLNQGVVLGTDYNWDAPATNKVRITTVGAGNFKVRVV